jgi:starch synthase
VIAVLSVASEIFPLIKTGGLADVAGALPGALAPHGIDMHSLVPGYPAVLQKLADTKLVFKDAAFFGGPAEIRAGTYAGLNIFALDAPHLFARAGNPYVAPDGSSWQDNPQRFAALSYAAHLIGKGDIAHFHPDIIHLHDWQAALAAAYIHFGDGPRPATVLTIHNLAFQGLARSDLLETLRLPAAAYHVDGAEFYGSISALKAGIQYADRVTTVSPTYAAEICAPENGMGLDGLLRARRSALSGIVNGIDTAVWNPANDPALPAAFNARSPNGKKRCKSALQRRFGLDLAESALLYGVVSRLSHQKGLDVLLGCLETLLATGAQLAVLGSGDADLQDGFVRAAASHPGRIAVMLGYDEPIAHLIQAGADAILVPSRFEPCGLTQLCALRYGAIPVVSRVGGLADTVIDANPAALAAKVATGIQFAPVSADALSGAFSRAAALWSRPNDWAALRRNALRTDVSWTEPAKAYADLYTSLIHESRAGTRAAQSSAAGSSEPLQVT